jgi:hypothetical protein
LATPAFRLARRLQQSTLMVALRHFWNSAVALGAVGVAAAVACNGSGSSGSTGLSALPPPVPSGGLMPTYVAADGGDAAAVAMDGAAAGPEGLFDALEPALLTACGNCHGQPSLPSQYPKWLVGPNRYATIKAYPGIVVPDVESSKLLTIGVTVPHAGGPGLTGTLLTQVTTWLTAEANALAAAPLPTTAPFSLTAGANVVDLSSLVPGASLSFSATIDPTLITFADLQITAPGNIGLHVSHPVFQVVIGSAAYPDVSDAFSNTDETISPGESAPLGDGIFVLDVEESANETWTSTDKIQVAFNTIVAAAVAPPDAGMDGEAGPVGPPPCQAPSAFVTNAVPAIQNNMCLTCHQGQNPTATSNLDLTMLGTDNAAACAQALMKVNLMDKTMSDILLAPTGGVPSHPFQSASPNYKPMMLVWIDAE